MGQPVWETPAGNLGVVAENTFFTLPLLAEDPSNQTITYSVVAGIVPPGLRLNNQGVLSGVPTKVNANPTSQTIFNTDITTSFTVRATTTTNKVADQTFSMTVTGEVLPTIVSPNPGNLGEFYTGQFLSIQITAVDTIPGAILNYTISTGGLPAGVSINSATGMISGHIIEVPLDPTLLQGFDKSLYDTTPYDFNSVSANKTFTFTVAVSDGIQSAYATYSIFVIAKSTLTADNTQLTADDSLFPTADEDTKSLPFMLTPGPSIGTAVSTDYFAFQFQAEDPNGDSLTFQAGTFLYINSTHITCDSTIYTCDETKINSGTPPGLTLDPFTGWLYGLVPPLLIGIVNYTFTISVFKTEFPSYISVPTSYTLTVDGINANVITWLTPSNLGTMNNGDVSMFYVAATSSSGSGLSYQLAQQSGSVLPAGLQLQQDGLIVGRASFEVFTLDHHTTTFDSNTTTFDSVYSFDVEAIDSTKTATSTKTFTITVEPTYDAPYDDLYLIAYQPDTPRTDFRNFINDPTVFPQSSIYRFNDSNFGIAQDLRMLTITGLNPATSDVYLAAMQRNHYRKSLWFGNLKTAIATDSNNNVVYEVVYVDAVDQLENVSDLSIPTVAGLSQYGEVESSIGIVYPNSIIAMRDQLAFGPINLGAELPSNADNAIFTADNINFSADISSYPNIGTSIGISTYASLPLWMSSVQSNGKILGYTQAFVICYAQPGQSGRIVYNIEQSEYNFSENYFLVDRYILDNTLSEFYNYSTGEFLPNVETTFDKFISVVNPLPVVATVDYALQLPYTVINGQTISEINSFGGFDGVPISLSSDGDLIVFAQQELYDGITNPNYGWTDPSNTVAVIESFDNPSITFDSTVITFDLVYDVDTISGTTGIIPGYAQVQAHQSTVNMRAGVWQVSINQTTQIVTLVFRFQVETNQLVSVLDGNTYGGTTILYNPIIGFDATVPEYIISESVVLGHETTFDSHSTRFIENKDAYTPFGSGTYLEFPKTDILV